MISPTYFEKNQASIVHGTIRAILLSSAFSAMFSSPYPVELLHYTSNYFWVISNYSALEIASLLAFCAYACASEVRASRIRPMPIDHHRLQMHARTEYAFHSLYKPRILVEIPPERGAGLLCVQQTYLDDSDCIDPETWEKRSFGNRFLENTLRLVSPLL